MFYFQDIFKILDFKICGISDSFSEILRRIKNEIWSDISETEDKHLQPVFSSIVKIGNKFQAF